MGNEIKKIIGTFIAVMLVFIIGIITGKYYFSTTEIKVVEKKVYETKWKTKIKTEYLKEKPMFTEEDYDLFYRCTIAPIKFEDWTENNYLYVKAFDECKEAEARYEIGTKGDWKIYAGIGLGGFALGTSLYLILR